MWSDRHESPGIRSVAGALKVDDPSAFRRPVLVHGVHAGLRRSCDFERHRPALAVNESFGRSADLSLSRIAAAVCAKNEGGRFEAEVLGCDGTSVLQKYTEKEVIITNDLA